MESNDKYDHIELANIESLDAPLLIISDHIYLRSRIDVVRKILNENPSVKILPLSLRVCGELEQANIIDYINYSDYISSSMLEEVMTIKADLWTKWHKHLNLKFEYEGIDLFFCDDFLRNWFFEDYTYLYLLLNSFFSLNEFSSVIAFLDKNIQQPEFIDTESFIYFLLPLLKKKFNYDCYRFGRDDFTVHERGFRFLSSSNQPLESEKNINKNKKRVGLMMSGQKDTVPVFEAYQNSGFDVYPLLGSFCDPKDQYKGSNCNVEYGAEIVEISADMKKTIDILWEKFEHNLHEMPHEFIFSNVLLRPIFKNIFYERLPHLYRTAFRIDKILEDYEFDFICISDHAFPETIILSELCKKYKTQVVIYSHTSWPIHTFPWPDYCRVLTWNKMSVRHWNRVSPQIEPATIGSPRFWCGEKVKKSNKETKKLKLLLITNTAEYSLRPIIDIDSHIKSLKTFFEIPLEMNNKIEVVVKIKGHFENKALYSHLAAQNKSDVDISIYQDEGFLDLIDSSDLVVGWNLLSTAHLESVSRGKPVIIVKDSFLINYDSEPIFPDEIFLSIKGKFFWTKILTFYKDRSQLKLMLSHQFRWLENEIPVGKYEKNMISGLKEIGIV